MFDVKALCSAVFYKPRPTVVEAYSEFDQEPLIFREESDLDAYIERRFSQPKSHVHIIIVYEDMGGSIKKRKIELNGNKFKQHTFRYTWDGWGLISLQLHLESPHLSGVSANSESRALKWFPTHPEFGPVDEWNWNAVQSHTRRLQRVFKKSA